MSRIYNPDSAGKERIKLTRCIVLALRELMRQTQIDEKSHDLALYIGIALLEITGTVESSVIAWEKKGYWVKADRFRMDWSWTEKLGNQMKVAVLTEDWAAIAMLAAQIGQRLVKVEVPQRNKLGTPWVGAYSTLHKG